MMQRQHKALLVIASLLLAGFAIGDQVSHMASAQVPVNKSTGGTIILGGGYFDQENIAALLKRMTDLAGGAGISVVIIPTADPQQEPATRTGSSTALIDYEKAARLSFARLGVQRVTVLHTRDRNVADSETFAAPLRSANCVWIPGGDPQLLFGVYPNTRVQRELQGVLGRGGVVTGDSAGALVIGQGLLAIDLDHPEKVPEVQKNGFGLLRNAFVMSHVNRYRAGVVELGSETFVSDHPDLVCVLIEEHTALIIQDDQVARLIGSGKAGIVSHSHGIDSVVWLSRSERYDLRTRALVQ